MIIIASDHAGVALKSKLLQKLSDQGILTLDLGTNDDKSVDYPDYAHRLCELLVDDVGVLICGTGIGMAIAANRHRHIRCAVVNTIEIARLSRMHNNANVLALGARIVDDDTALAILNVFLDTPYEGGRHDTRLAKLNLRQKQISAY